MEIGSTHGLIDVQDVLPDPRTVFCNVDKSYEEILKCMIPKVMKAIVAGECAATTDMWMDKFIGNSYIALTVHYLDENWSLNRHVLFTAIFESENKTAENIRLGLKRKFIDMGFHIDLFEKLIFVTDQEPALVKALESNERLSCMAHLINTILRNSFSGQNLTLENDQNSFYNNAV